MMYKLVVSLAALLLNVSSLFYVYHHADEPSGGAGLVLFQLVVSALITALIVPLLPERYRSQKLRASVLLFLMQVVIPFFGSVAVLFSIVIPAAKSKPKRLGKGSMVLEPKLKHRIDEYSLQKRDQGALREILEFSRDSLDRLSAVWSASLLPEKQSVELFRVALKDEADDVRLLAYSFLDKIENRYMEKVADIRKRKETADKTEINYWRLQLASQYWEMVYLGISAGGVEKFFLNAAQEELKNLLNEQENHAACFLLGRIFLVLNEYDKAAKAFQNALRNGGKIEKIEPYLAEAYFGQKNFKALSDLSAKSGGLRSVA